MKKKRVIISTTIVVVTIALSVLVITGASKIWDDFFVTQQEYDRLPKEKKVDIDKENQRREDAKTGIIKKADKNKDNLPPTSTEDPWIVGLFEKEAPPGVKTIQVNNVWNGAFDDSIFRLYAGNDGDNVEQGVVFIHIMEKNKKTKVFKQNPTPDMSGSLTITEGDGKWITLTSIGGKKYIFDAENLSFTVK